MLSSVALHPLCHPDTLLSHMPITPQDTGRLLAGQRPVFPNHHGLWNLRGPSVFFLILGVFCSTPQEQRDPGGRGEKNPAG